MAFLRSVTRCNHSFVVSRKFSSSSIRSTEAQRRGHVFASLNNAKFTRAELLACQKYYFDLRRELNTANNDCEQKSSMSTVAAAKTAAPSSAASSASDPKPQRDPLDVSFNDPIAAFKSKTTSELLRAYFVYLMCSSEYLVENNMKVMRPNRSGLDHTVSFLFVVFVLYWCIVVLVYKLLPSSSTFKCFDRKYGKCCACKNANMIKLVT